MCDELLEWMKAISRLIKQIWEIKTSCFGFLQKQVTDRCTSGPDYVINLSRFIHGDVQNNNINL